jgi:predicted Rossmann-fold nucleotide-binding protein
MPGGIGTLQELVEVWQYMRLGDIPKKPLLIYGSFWSALIEQMLEEAFVNERDLGYVCKVDSPDAMIETLQTWFRKD